jgi:hypothetical protein
MVVDFSILWMRMPIGEFHESHLLMSLCEVSGVEQTTAASFEARHSYTLDDIFWDRTAWNDLPLRNGDFS